MPITSFTVLPFPQLPAATGASLLGVDEAQQALVVLVAGRAALEVGAHAGDLGVRVGAGGLQVDVAIELREALLAAQLRAGRPECTCQETIGVEVVPLLTHRPSPPSSGSKPRSASARRSLRRASCSVL